MSVDAWMRFGSAKVELWKSICWYFNPRLQLETKPRTETNDANPNADASALVFHSICHFKYWAACHPRLHSWSRWKGRGKIPKDGENVQAERKGLKLNYCKSGKGIWWGWDPTGWMEVSVTVSGVEADGSVHLIEFASSLTCFPMGLCIRQRKRSKMDGLLWGWGCKL